jgi:glutaminyl-peptide cyclotransferase
MIFKINLVKVALGLGLVITLFSACKNETKSNTETTTETPVVKDIKVPAFDRDSAYAFVEKQVSFGPRVPGSLAHSKCKKWLVSSFKRFGFEVIEQNFQAKVYTGKTLPGTNIIARYKPNLGGRILLSAHWDSRHIAEKDPKDKNSPILGADDGGSGVGVLLEIARQIQANPLEFGIDIVLFDVEDYGDSGENGNPETWCLGSQHWSKNPHTAGYKADFGILLDMVGSSGARFAKEGTSMYYASGVVEKVWNLATKMGYGNYFVQDLGGQLIDDHLFVNKYLGIPTIDIINTTSETPSGFGKYHHTHEDNMNVIDRYTLRAVGQTVTAVVYRHSVGGL